MDPVIDNEFLGCKNEPIDEIQNVGNIARSWQWRERGINPPNYPNTKTVLENLAEDTLVQKTLQIRVKLSSSFFNKPIHLNSVFIFTAIIKINCILKTLHYNKQVILTPLFFRVVICLGIQDLHF